MVGISPDQLTQVATMMQGMPPEQLQQMIAGGMGGMGGPGGPGGGAPPGQNVIRLSEEEMAAVNRLTAMGFDRNEAAQAYLACDKNEALAANLLREGGFGGGWEDAPGGGGGGGGAPGGDDIYE
jgi:UV excision repair protein RAD23